MSSKDDFIVFGKPVFSEAEIESVAETLRSGWVGCGPKTVQFEEAFARYQKCGYAQSVASGTAALTIALRALGVGPGHEVITTAMTFAATVNAIIECGATPILVDSDGGPNLDLEQVEKAISSKTKVIIPVHLYGLPVNLDRLHEIRDRHGVKIIHDCAHAIETTLRGKTIPSYGDVTCYSFYSTKNITTVEGGMICSNDQIFIGRAKLMASQGMSKDAWKRFSKQGYSHYDITTRGFKFNFTDLQASIGLIQLADIEKKYARRKSIWERLQQSLHSDLIALPAESPSHSRHAFHLYAIQVTEETDGARDTFLKLLQDRGIGCGVHYRSIPELTYFAKVLHLETKNFPRATQWGERTLSLPLTPYLSEREVERIIQEVNEVQASLRPAKKKGAYGRR